MCRLLLLDAATTKTTIPSILMWTGMETTLLPKYISIAQSPKLKNLGSSADTGLDHEITWSAAGQRTAALDRKPMPQPADKHTFDLRRRAIAVTLAC